MVEFLIVKVLCKDKQDHFPLYSTFLKESDDLVMAQKKIHCDCLNTIKPVRDALDVINGKWKLPIIITEVVPLDSFKLNQPQYLNYYYANPEKPFCQNIVNPKLIHLLQHFATEVDKSKLAHLLSKDSNP
jgi:hypothetical protein